MTDCNNLIGQSPRSNIALNYLWQRLMIFSSHLTLGVFLHAELATKEAKPKALALFKTYLLNPFTQPYLLLLGLFLISCAPSHLTDLTLYTVSLHDLFPSSLTMIPWVTLMTT